mmetsp:Transcript_31260/g.42707  ORF Transcript_31260/g.42707 Transcript_31260/m.42707 type:complete len:108 (+) Transcript_31260:413-736(+)
MPSKLATKRHYPVLFTRLTIVILSTKSTFAGKRRHACSSVMRDSTTPLPDPSSVGQISKAACQLAAVFVIPVPPTATNSNTKEEDFIVLLWLLTVKWCCKIIFCQPL